MNQQYPVTTILLLLVAAWITQLMFSFLQLRRFYKRLNVLKREGARAAIGFSGSNLKTKVYAVLVVDEEENIVRAEKLSGITVFASLKPVEELIGRPLGVLDRDEPLPGIRRKAWDAFRQAKKFLDEEKEKRAGAAEEEPEEPEPAEEM
ncbi:MAG TPA: transcriptional regulator [Chloroflexi bacterium]|nr:transcriptional regulator [Chloroflexota bacterium]